MEFELGAQMKVFFFQCFQDSEIRLKVDDFLTEKAVFFGQPAETAHAVDTGLQVRCAFQEKALNRREDILKKAFDAGGASARQTKEKQQRHGCGHPSPNCFLSKHRPVPVLLEPGGTNLKRKAPSRLTRAGFGKFAQEVDLVQNHTGTFGHRAQRIVGHMHRQTGVFSKVFIQTAQ